MSYRDDLDARAARLAALDAEVVARTRERDAARAVIDEARVRARVLLPCVRSASPCGAAWSEMTGHERVRTCPRCDQRVYDLSSAMQPSDAEAMILAGEGRVAERYFERGDGTVLIADCPIGSARRRRRRRRRAALALAAVAATAALVFTWGPSIGDVRRAALDPRCSEAQLDLPTEPTPLCGPQALAEASRRKSLTDQSFAAALAARGLRPAELPHVAIEEFVPYHHFGEVITVPVHGIHQRVLAAGEHYSGCPSMELVRDDLGGIWSVRRAPRRRSSGRLSIGSCGGSCGGGAAPMPSGFVLRAGDTFRGYLDIAYDSHDVETRYTSGDCTYPASAAQ